MSKRASTTKKPLIEKETVNKADGAYNLSVHVNGEVRSVDTDNLVDSLLEVGLPFVKTRVKFVISKGNKRFERMVLPRMARRYFANRIYAQVFVNNISKIIG